jgi:hypothetical protein
MRKLAGIAIIALAILWATPAPAQWIFGRKTKVNPTQRVPELILTLKTDSDDRKRAHAAAELREYDTATYTEIVPTLADVLLNDKKANVRMEALTSISKIRPISTIAGQAMEKAAADDEALRVRVQAKTALGKYYLAGYSPRKNDAATTKKKQTDEPPLVNGSAPMPSPPGVKSEPPAASTFPRRLPPGVVSPAEKTPAVTPPVEGPSLFPKGF